MLGTIVLDPLLGSTLGGRYLVRECIDRRGALGRYGAEIEPEGTPVLATVFSGRELDASALDRFRATAVQLRALDHVACTALVDFGAVPGEHLFVVERGESWHDLQRELDLKGRLRIGDAVELTLQLLDGLQHLHAHGVLHGAVCPAALRLYFAGDGALKLQVSSAVLAFLAVRPAGLPEAEDYAGEASAVAADLRAAGAILAQMLTGNGPTDEEILECSADIPGPLLTVVERAVGLRGEPYRSAEEMGRDLAAMAGQPRFGRYTVLRKLAEGGMGELLLARAEGIPGVEGLNRLCVLKTVRPALAADEAFVQRFLAEARVLASLHHGNIVPVYDVGRVAETYYIAMEYIAGRDLRRVLDALRKQERRLPLPLALVIAREMANGLAYAHRARLQGVGGLVHRDVSPHNVLISREGEVKLIDFGLARLPRQGHLTDDGVIIGKLPYLAPEQARAQRLDRRTDIYALGLVLFEMLTGGPFFTERGFEEMCAAVYDPQPRAPSVEAAGIPETVDQICLRACAPNPADRYQRAEDLRDDLAGVLAQIAPRTNPEELGALLRELFARLGDEEAPSPVKTLPPQRTGAPTARRGSGEVPGVSLRSGSNPSRAPIVFAPTLEAELSFLSGEVPVDQVEPDADPQPEVIAPLPRRALSPLESAPTMAAAEQELAAGEQRPLEEQRTGRLEAHALRPLGTPAVASARAPALPPAPAARAPDYVRIVIIGFTILLAALAGFVLWISR